MLRYLLPAVTLAALLTSAPNAYAKDIKTLIAERQASGETGPLSPKDIPYTYVVTADIKSGEGDDRDAYVAKYQVNPKAAPGARLTFIDAPLETFPEDFQTQMNKMDMEATEADIAKEFWCADSEDEADDPDMTPEDMTVIREDAREGVIAISNDILRNMMNMDDGDGGDMPKKVMKRLTAELTLSKPDLNLRNMKVWLTRPTTIKIVAKLKNMNIEQSCDLAPNGIPYVTVRKMRVSGKAFGKSFNEDAMITVSDLQPL